MNLFLLLVAIVCVNCSGTTQKQKNKEKDMGHPNNYTLIYDFPLDGEMMVNDVVIDKSLYGNLSGTEFINYFILKNGQQKIQTELTHPYLLQGKLIDSNTLKSASEEFALYNTQSNNGEVQEIQLLKKLNFPDLKAPTPSVKSEWSFDAQLPFELEGWKNSEDLSSWDPKALETAVVKKFNQLRDLLNSGDGQQFVNELTFSNNEFFISNYYTDDQKKAYLKNLVEDFSQQKDRVPPVENYRLRVMGGGKVVTLETMGKFKGQGALTTDVPEKNKLYAIYVMLDKPKNSKDFRVVRMLSFKTGLIK
ncbi:hypothetical protein A8C56_18405 [Niabella ginsenosidivorans]|uniref:Uncharacterized protein n=1 Tax=Niabella ginsenosidivorans TaxID=1176587 RepID=A0A1A9I5S8_9BACT|nr:hypothetical protein [Niabella ginsenosidivorans]ANH82685.1 hypothetical protein A8C56_18405 [Niabella ginsenosidivorans]